MRAIITVVAALALGLTACSELIEEKPRDDCRENCEDLGFFDCASDARIAECGTQCDLRSEAVVRDFNTCKSGGICRSAGCLDVLIPGSTANNAANADAGNNDSALVLTCKDNCDAIGACLDIDRAGTVIDCKAACEQASADATQSFIACEANGFSCEEDVACFDFLGVPYTY